MPVDNSEIAEIFNEVADLLEIYGESYFRVRAYRNAARMIRDLSTPLYKMAADPSQKLVDLPGIGKDLAARIHEILDTGELSLREELEEQLPVGLLEVTKIPGIGPRKAHTLFLELDVQDIESLGEAARSGKIRNIKGFGKKTEDNILEGIYFLEGNGGRITWADAQVYAQSIVEHMSELKGLKRIEVAGSYRRLVETVGDLDILVTCENPQAAMDRFKSFRSVNKIIASGSTKTSLVLKAGVQVDMRVVDDDSFGAALQYFTGSQSHSVALRGMAIRKGLKLNEYGVFRDDEKVAGKTEEEVYAALDLPWIPPELRENRGEIRLALEDRLPELVELGDIRGDLHVHTNATDGEDSLEDIARAARKKGYLYIAITDHTLRTRGGLNDRELKAQWKEIEKLNESVRTPRILRGVEVDILKDGSLDISNKTLGLADFVTATVHYDTKMSRSKMTRRIVKAMSHPLVDALAHPTGRKLNIRPAYPVNMEDVIAAAARTGTWLELNAAPDRLDIDDLTCRSARDHGVKVHIASDAHSVKGLDVMRFGINQARRGWLEKQDVVNTKTYRSLKGLLK